MWFEPNHYLIYNADTTGLLSKELKDYLIIFLNFSATMVYHD